MHFKFSSIMIQVAISFMYGMFIPSVFLITLFGLINMYLCEKICLAYWYKQPPNYDKEMVEVASSWIKRSPVLMFILGYWALTNVQVFNNTSENVETQNSIPNPHHDYYDSSNKHSQVILLYLFALLCYYQSERILKHLKKLGIVQIENKFNKQHRVNERLNSFFMCLNGND